jgi:hypothetical protein
MLMDGNVLPELCKLCLARVQSKVAVRLYWMWRAARCEEGEEGRRGWVAGKLGVLLHRLWVTGEVYEPLRNARTQQRVKKAAA